jgi:hypothetical protein
MKSIRIPLLLLVLVAVLLLMAGCSKHYVDVYINEEKALVTLANCKAIKPLWMFPGDYVIFNNTREIHWVMLEFPEGMFEVTKTDTIWPGHRVILKVTATGKMEGIISVISDGPIGNPEAKVGEDP